MKFSIIVGLLLISVLFAGCVGEDDALFEVRTMDNGLEVIFVESHHVPLVSVVITAKNGAYTESQEHDGLSHFYEHMFFKANKVIPSQEEYMKEVRNLGAWWNGWTSTEAVAYYFTVPEENFMETLQFMENAIRFPLFDDEELEREKEVILAEYDRADAQPGRALSMAMDELLWYEHYVRKNTLGNRTIIATNNREKMLTIQQRYYVPNNCALIIAGDVSAEEAFDGAEAIFSDWEEGADPFELYPVPEHPPLRESRSVIIERPVGAITLTMEFHGPSVYEDEDATYAADLFSFVINNPGSKFQKNLVDSGLFTSCSLWYLTQNNTGPIYITGQTDVENFFEARDALSDEINRFDDPDYFKNEEIDDAKSQVVVSRVFDFDTLHSSFISSGLPFWWAITGVDYYENYAENLNKVEKGDFASFAGEYLIDKPFVVGVLLSSDDRISLDLMEGDLL